MPTSRTPSARTHRRGPLAVLVTGLLALTVLLFTAGTASAHDVITGSDPADGSTVPTAPTQVSVTFDETPSPQGAALTVVGPDGAHHEQGAVAVRDKVVSVPVGALPQAGQYEIGYRVVSSDGHPVSGSVTFSLTMPSAPAGTATTGAPAQAAPADHSGHTDGTGGAGQPSPAAAAGPDTGSGGVPAWVFVVIAVVVVGGAVALVLRRRA